MRLLTIIGLSVLLMGLGSCREEAKSPGSALGQGGAQGGAMRLRAVLVSDQTPPSLRPLDLSTRADQILRQALLEEGRFISAPVDDHEACAAEIVLMYAYVVNGEVVARASAGVARVVIEGEVHCLIPGSGEASAETFSAEVADESSFGGAGRPEGKEALSKLLARLSSELASQLHGQVSMRHAPDEVILSALKESSHPGVLMEAASEARERRLRSALKALIKLTSHEHHTVVLRAAAALGALAHGDEACVRALAILTRGSDVERHLVAIIALGDAGGPRALRTLLTLAEGHPEPALRAAARSAAARARQRAESNPDEP